MNKGDVVNLICKLAEVHGKVRNFTVNEQFDATAATSMDWKVWMYYGFGLPVNSEYGQEPPESEMVEVHISCIWGEEITVTSPSIKMRAYFDTEIDMDSHQKVMRCHWTESCTEDEILKVLERLIWEGDWSGTDPATVEEDPMGCLADYE